MAESIKLKALPYLFFNRNCEAAFKKYKGIFGGEFSMCMRYGEIPEGQSCPAGSLQTIPEKDLQKIMHISLPIGEKTQLMGCDAVGGIASRAKLGENVAIHVTQPTPEDADRVFASLAEGGHVELPMRNCFWESYFGIVIDEFGVKWMVGTSPKGVDKPNCPYSVREAKVELYLLTPGNCKAAFALYRSVFGGSFKYEMLFKDVPDGGCLSGKPIPEHEKELVMHVSLPIGEDTLLMGTDTSSHMFKAGPPGEYCSIHIGVPCKEEADRMFEALSDGGQIIMAMQPVFWGVYFGMVQDKFGFHWMIDAPSDTK
mmetsp:Transcript_6971/g.25680  ORF Transcript_6971/g.25680 Transcript_6971/m.25680 type:complete len:313 (-) Transcript_6971:298-1236(-)